MLAELKTTTSSTSLSAARCVVVTIQISNKINIQFPWMPPNKNIYILSKKKWETDARVKWVEVEMKILKFHIRLLQSPLTVSRSRVLVNQKRSKECRASIRITSRRNREAMRHWKKQIKIFDILISQSLLVFCLLHTLGLSSSSPHRTATHSFFLSLVIRLIYYIKQRRRGFWFQNPPVVPVSRLCLSIGTIFN